MSISVPSNSTRNLSFVKGGAEIAIKGKNTFQDWFSWTGSNFGQDGLGGSKKGILLAFAPVKNKAFRRALTTVSRVDRVTTEGVCRGVILWFWARNHWGNFKKEKKGSSSGFNKASHIFYDFFFLWLSQTSTRIDVKWLSHLCFSRSTLKPHCTHCQAQSY